MMRKVFLALIPLFVTAVPTATPSLAQGWRWTEDGPVFRDRRGRSRYYSPYYDERPYYRQLPPPGYRDPWDQPQRRNQRIENDDGAPRVVEGGPRPDIDPIPPRSIDFSSRHAPGTIIIDTAGRQLILVQGGGTALRYPISVGREGFSWTGEEKISRIAEWPDWHPPAEMRERDPKLPTKMTGGLRNPLGAKALYLGSTLYRIHGTNDAKSIGRASSSGCFRMLNGHVIDLAERVRVGTKVIVTPNLRAAEASTGKRS